MRRDLHQLVIIVVLLFVHSTASLVVKKCCPSDQSVHRAQVPSCTNGSSFDPTDWIDLPNTTYTIENNSTVDCNGLDWNVYLPGTFADHVFKIQSSGEAGVVLPFSIYKVFRQTGENYCVDIALEPSTNMTERIAIGCLPKTMEVLRYILRDVFPYTHFFSAALLLATLVVYLILPSLRNNIQGMAMICFLSCMIVVQVEYGIILSIPYEPHTWCFPKVWVSTYFRYASSTWITVMGFNIWSQLSNGPRRFTKPELIKRFAWCSLYAWGLPLILNMVVVGYIETLKKKRIAAGAVVFQRCWFGNPVLSHLLSTPNVILVTANLIFFIPSAIKVYGSLKFLRTSVSSPVALSKLEKDRLKTIFRFFLLMQFYTIPRIIHEIVDADGAVPELLIISVSLYCLIGPAMFGFFVCKTEVIKQLFDLRNGSNDSRSSSGKTISSRIASLFRSTSQESSNNMSRKTSTTSIPASLDQVEGNVNPGYQATET